MQTATISSLVYHFSLREYQKNNRDILSAPFNFEVNFVTTEIAFMGLPIRVAISVGIFALCLISWAIFQKNFYHLNYQQREQIIRRYLAALPLISEVLRIFQNLSVFSLYFRLSPDRSSQTK